MNVLAQSMDSNTFYRIRKKFEEKEEVERVSWSRVSKIPENMSPVWRAEVRGQTVSSYKTGSESSLVVFDNREGKHAFWCSGMMDFRLGGELVSNGAESRTGLDHLSGYDIFSL